MSLRSRALKLLPAALVAGVLIASLALPHNVPFGGVKLLTYGYGYGPGGGFAPPPVQYHPLTPARIMDTRLGGAPLGPGQTLDVQVTGQGGVPLVGVTAVVINVTATDGTAASFLTVYPTGLPRPGTSNLDWTPHKTVPNLVEIAVGTGGKVSVYNAQGNTQVIFDVEGYWQTPTRLGADGLFNALVPSRVLDTRNGGGPVGPGATINLKVTGVGGVPATGVEAVVLNVTVTNATAPSYITVFPAGTAQPVASNVNFVAGQTVPNRVIVKVGTGGMVSFFNAAGNVALIADVNGWFTDGTTSNASGDVFTGTEPNRIMDTRQGGSPIGPGQTIHMNVAGQGGVPASGAHSVVINVTVTNPTAGSYLTLWPTGATQPVASDLNFVSGLTVANLVIVKIGSGGQVDVYNAAGSTHVIVDVVGWHN